MKRLFVALEFEPSLRDVLAPRLGRLKRSFEDLDIECQWVRPENLHLTLLFLGETDPGRLPVV
jgi:2'-5' RNA ligase